MTREQAIQRVIDAWRDGGIAVEDVLGYSVLAEIAVDVLWNIEKREPGGASAGAGNETKPSAQGSRSVSGGRLDGAEVASPPLASFAWPPRICIIETGPDREEGHVHVYETMSETWAVEIERRITAIENSIKAHASA